jgi:hypothetical protein
VAPTADLEIVLHFEDGTIHGTVRAAGGPPAAFTGWLGLIASIERHGDAAPQLNQGDHR